MPIDLTMASHPESEPSAPARDDHAAAGIAPAQLAKVVRRLESGFYDRAVVREKIAGRVLEDLTQ